MLANTVSPTRQASVKESQLTLNLRLDIVDSVRRLHLKGDSLAREGLDEDLHRDEGLYRQKLLVLEERSTGSANCEGKGDPMFMLGQQKAYTYCKYIYTRGSAYLDKLSSSTFKMVGNQNCSRRSTRDKFIVWSREIFADYLCPGCRRQRIT